MYKKVSIKLSAIIRLPVRILINAHLSSFCFILTKSALDLPPLVCKKAICGLVLKNPHHVDIAVSLSHAIISKLNLAFGISDLTATAISSKSCLM